MSNVLEQQQQTTQNTRKQPPRHLTLAVSEKELWKRNNYGALIRISRKHRCSRSMVTAAFWGKDSSFSKKGLRIHRSIDRAIFGSASIEASIGELPNGGQQ